MGKAAFHESASAAPHGKGDRLLRDNAIIKGVAHPDYGDEALTSPAIPDEFKVLVLAFVPAQRSLLLASRFLARPPLALALLFERWLECLPSPPRTTCPSARPASTSSSRRTIMFHDSQGGGVHRIPSLVAGPEAHTFTLGRRAVLYLGYIVPWVDGPWLYLTSGVWLDSIPYLRCFGMNDIKIASRSRTRYFRRIVAKYMSYHAMWTV